MNLKYNSHKLLLHIYNKLYLTFEIKVFLQ